MFRVIFQSPISPSCRRNFSAPLNEDDYKYCGRWVAAAAYRWRRKYGRGGHSGHQDPPNRPFRFVRVAMTQHPPGLVYFFFSFLSCHCPNLPFRPPRRRPSLEASPGIHLVVHSTPRWACPAPGHSRQARRGRKSSYVPRVSRSRPRVGRWRPSGGTTHCDAAHLDDKQVAALRNTVQVKKIQYFLTCIQITAAVQMES